MAEGYKRPRISLRSAVRQNLDYGEEHCDRCQEYVLGSREDRKASSDGVSNLRSQRFRVEERPVSAASPKIGEDDHTCNRGVRTPKRGECVPLELHYSQKNRQVCGAEDYHRPYFREKQRTARCNHIQ